MTKETYLKIKEDFKNRIATEIWVPGYRHAAYWCIKHRVDLKTLGELLDDSNASVEEWMNNIPSIEIHISRSDYNLSKFRKIVHTYEEWLHQYEGEEAAINNEVVSNSQKKGLLSRVKEAILG